MLPHVLLSKLIRRTGLDEHYVGLLTKLERHMAPMAPEIALAFYDYLGRDEEMRQILWGAPGRVERLYEKFAGWYRELFSGRYDDDYAERRMRVGLVHAAMGVKPSFIMPAMGIVQELSLEHMRNCVRGPDIFSSVEAFEKIMAVENGMMQESYMMALEQGFRLGSSADRELATVLGAKEMLGRAADIGPAHNPEVKS